MSETILIVEDEEDVLELLSTILRLEGYKVRGAKDGEEALSIARGDNPNMILLDIQLPKLNGYEVCRSVKLDPAMSHTKVLMMSGMTQNFDRMKAHEAGADDYIAKPFSSFVLLEKVEDLLRRS